MNASPRFGRLLTAMVTPFDGEGNLDEKRCAQLANKLFDEGSDGVLVNGTTGESPTISRDERVRVFKTVLESAGGRGPIIANVGDNCTQDSVEFAAKVSKLGVDAVMVVTPYYNKPPQEGLYRHFRAVAEAVDIPVILYNIPGRCVVNIEPATILRLARDVENIVAVKQANSDLDQVSLLTEQAPQGFDVYSGDDSLTLPMMERGAAGIISVLSHVAGPSMKSMIEYFLAGNEQKAHEIESIIMPLADALFMTSNPIMVKEALAQTGFSVGGVRLPLIEPTEAQRNELSHILNETFAQLQALKNECAS